MFISHRLDHHQIFAQWRGTLVNVLYVKRYLNMEKSISPYHATLHTLINFIVIVFDHGSWVTTLARHAEVGYKYVTDLSNV